MLFPEAKTNAEDDEKNRRGASKAVLQDVERDDTRMSRTTSNTARGRDEMLWVRVMGQGRAVSQLVGQANVR